MINTTESGILGKEGILSVLLLSGAADPSSGAQIATLASSYGAAAPFPVGKSFHHPSSYQHSISIPTQKMRYT